MRIRIIVLAAAIFLLSFHAAAATKLRVGPVSLPAAVIGKPYSAAIIPMNGGKSPYVWLLVEGRLPRGLKLSNSTGLISGTPMETGKFNFTVQVSDSSR